MITELGDKVRYIRTNGTWIEGEAVRQLAATAEYPGMLQCVAMPDIHPAKGSPNGVAFLADRMYPHLVGTDCGCGVGFWTTEISIKKFSMNRTVERLDGLDQPWDGDTNDWLARHGVLPTAFDSSLGTPGFGNHFVELTKVANVFDDRRFHELGLTEDRVCLLVHSGSRGFGESVMMEHAAKYGAQGIMADSDAGQLYLKQHDRAFNWAKANRQLCADRVFQALKTEGGRLLDVCHNSVTPETLFDGCRCWLHRKGAAPADCGPVLIPGSRGDLSYLVDPLCDSAALNSLAHGAGRKISRGDAMGKLRKLYRNKDDLRRNPFGGRVICGTAELLWEEAPECYKRIDYVIEDLLAANLIKVVAALQPLVTFKTSETTETILHDDRKKRQMERSAAREAKRSR